MKKLMIMACAAVVAAVGYGGTIALELTGDCTFAEALAAYNEANETSYVDSDGGTSLGENVVEISAASDLETPPVVTFTTMLGSWKGNLTIKSGVVAHVVIDQTNGSAGTYLGNASTGAVYVESGATLWTDGKTNTTDAQNGACLMRKVYISGTGADGWEGALVRDSGNSSADRATMPKTMEMQGDATFTAKPDNTYGNIFYAYCSLNMNGHKLTVKRHSKGVNRWSCYANEWTITNPGNIDANGVTMVFRGVNWGGSAENVMHLMNDSRYWLQSGAFTLGWTLKIDEGSGGVVSAMEGQGHSFTSETVNCWPGPVILNGSLVYRGDTKATAASWGAQPRHVNWGFGGSISGTGYMSISSISEQTSVTNRFRLKSENTFTGGIAFTNIYDVVLGSPKAIPSGSGVKPLLVKDSNLRLDYAKSAGDFVMPATTFDGAGTIAPSSDKQQTLLHAGEFASLTKTGSGILDIKARLTGGELNIKGGTVRLAQVPAESTSRANYAGVYAGSSSYFTLYNNAFTASDKIDIGWGLKPINEVAPYIVYSNATANALAIFSYPHGAYGDKTYDWKAKFYSRVVVYNGWLWNNTGAEKKIKVICTLNAYVRLTIGNTQVSSAEPTRSMATTDCNIRPGTWEFTLQPGANRFDVRTFDRYGDNSTTDSKSKTAAGDNCWWCYGNICTNGLSGWDDTHGLVWTDEDHKDSTDMKDYHRFEDNGDGLVLTTLGDFGDDYQHVDTLTGSGTLDLNGGHAVIDNYNEAVQIVNGAVTYNNTRSGTISLGSGENAITSEQDAANNRASVVGLGYGKSAKNAGWYSDVPINKSTAEYLSLVTNTVVQSTELFYVKPDSWMWKDTKDGVNQKWYRYEGYLWNDEVANKTIKVVYAANEYYQITIGDQVNGRKNQLHKLTASETATPYESFTVTLQPGANYFKVDGYSRFGGQNSNVYVGNVATNGLVNWDDCHGLMWSEQLDSVNMSDYHSFAAGSGLVMTRIASDIDEFTRVNAADDSTTTLNGDMATCALNGFGTYTGGKMIVSGNWNLTKEQIANAAFASGVEFAEDAQLVLADGTWQEVYTGMDATAKQNGYKLATGVNRKPKLVRAANDKRMSLVVRGDNKDLYLVPGLGTLVIAK